MGIKAEFNPDLALRSWQEYKNGRRRIEECLPKKIEAGKIYKFLKKGQRIFWLNDDPFWSKGELPLVQTDGKEKLSRPLAGIKILEVVHFLKDGEVYTKGKYKVIEVFTDKKIHFESYKKIES